MGESNIFSMLQKAHESAATGDAKMFGVEVAIVTNVKDDKKSGRVKVCFPRLARSSAPPSPSPGSLAAKDIPWRSVSRA